MREKREVQPGRRPHFRFEDLDVWQEAKLLAMEFHGLADQLERRKFYRYAEQLRAAGLSVSNNIAEGAGSIHPQEFIQFLNIARRSVSESVSMLLVFEAMSVLEENDIRVPLERCDKVSRMLFRYMESRRR